MGLPVIAPLNPSWNRMVMVLFKPFDLGKWFVLGFGAFLMGLGEGGANFNFGNWGSQDRKPNTQPADQMWVDAHAWISGHWTWIWIGALIGLPILIALWGVFLWLSSRGHFIFLDNLLKNKAEINGPWNTFKNEADSLFKWRFGIALGGAILIWGPMLWGAWKLLDLYVQAREFGVDCWLVVMGLAAWLIITFLSVVPLTLLLHDFVPVIQWHRRIGAGQAMKVFWNEVWPGNFWSLNLYYAWMLVLGMGAGMVMVVGMCCTCCLGALPYLSSVLFLPVFAIFRLYPAYYLAQLGPAWAIKEDGPSAGPLSGPPPLPAAQVAPGQTYQVVGVVGPADSEKA